MQHSAAWKTPPEFLLKITSRLKSFPAFFTFEDKLQLTKLTSNTKPHITRIALRLSTCLWPAPCVIDAILCTCNTSLNDSIVVSAGNQSSHAAFICNMEVNRD